DNFDYGEGKKLAEAVFYKYAKFPVVAVRFPIVMGEDDYTLRLHFYIENILNNQPIALENIHAKMSFIHAAEAAQFLRWAGYSHIEGPYNAAANGTIALSELIQLIEQVTGKSATIVEPDSEHKSPYSIPKSWFMTNEKAVQDGYTFTHLSDWLKPLIHTIAKDYA